MFEESNLGKTYNLKRKHYKDYYRISVLENLIKGDQNVLKFPELNFKPVLTIRYGPYTINGVSKYRAQKLRGLKDYFERKGFDINFVQCSILNYLSIMVFEREIHRRNLRYLMFNPVPDMDPICAKIVTAVEEVCEKIFYERNYGAPMTYKLKEYAENKSSENSLASY